jgi:hypothetical protein
MSQSLMFRSVPVLPAVLLQNFLHLLGTRKDASQVRAAARRLHLVTAQVENCRRR